MMKLSTGLRLYGIENCPTVSMTATATDNEIREVVKALGLREPPIVLAANPVQNHIKISIIRRPSNNYGFEGTEKKDGSRNPGLVDLLDRVYLKQYVEDINAGKDPKKAIIFCRGSNMLGEVFCHLMAATNYQFKDCRDAPFVMNHSSLLPPTEKVIEDRVSEISLYLSTNKMLMGVDLPNIDIIIFLRPFNHLAALIQGAGRGGRKRGDGLRSSVQVYQFYNTQDFTSNNREMSADMRRICESKHCTRALLEDYFAGESKSKQRNVKDPHSCCHNCDKASLSTVN